MLKELAQLTTLLRNAKDISEKLEDVIARLKEERIVGSAGGGLVKVEVDGLADPRRVTIEPALLKPEDKDLLEELLVGAMRDAIQKARERHVQLVTEFTGGLPLPGLDVFSKLLGTTG
ncbi:YbaB/EbfC family nucleoid-associated protein [Thermogutta sp.]|jgi:DNA-binding YbaB/EbfC family protein|uniref:YbaB/EbfC family nucleoid-associated protein n=1 Tax=Thermogutta sp. TaxID=1962930 RepID=UPI00321FDECA